MATILKFGKHGRIDISSIVGIEVSDHDSITFSKFGLTIPDDGLEEIVLRLKYGKTTCYRVKRESLDAEMTRIMTILGWE